MQCVCCVYIAAYMVAFFGSGHFVDVLYNLSLHCHTSQTAINGCRATIVGHVPSPVDGTP